MPGSIMNNQSGDSIECKTDLRHDTVELEDNLSEENFTQEIDVECLKDEYLNIDRTLNFLLRYNTKRKKPGRPKNNEANTPVKVPDTVSEELKSLTDIKDLHPGVLLDYLKKINSFNKKLLNSLDSLNDKYNILVQRKETCSRKNLLLEPATPTPLPEAATPNFTPQRLSHIDTSKAVSDKSHEDLTLKVDNLEQKVNSTVILCSGLNIEKILNEGNADNLKTDVLNELSRVNSILRVDDVTSIVPFGKHKKHVKVICATLQVKNGLLKEIRKKKLNNIFLSEYLTAFRNKLFYELRQIKKKYSSIVTSVYIRNRNLYYKLLSETNHKIIRRPQDLTELESFLSGMNTSSN